MAEKKANQTNKSTSQPADKSAVYPATGPGSSLPALPPARSHPACDPHCVDVTGVVPEDICIDPDITEGHPGYEESGDSEIIPLERLAAKKESEK